MLSHTDIVKKRIIKDISIEVNNCLHANKDQNANKVKKKFSFYNNH